VNRGDDLLTRGDSLPNWADDLVNHVDDLAKRANDLVIRDDNLVSRGNDLPNRADGLPNWADDLVNHVDDVANRANNLLNRADDLLNRADETWTKFLSRYSKYYCCHNVINRYHNLAKLIVDNFVCKPFPSVLAQTVPHTTQHTINTSNHNNIVFKILWLLLLRALVTAAKSS